MCAFRYGAGPLIAALVLLPPVAADPPAPGAPSPSAPGTPAPPAPGAPAPPAPAAGTEKAPVAPAAPVPVEPAALLPHRLLFPFGVRHARGSPEGMSSARIEAIESALAWLAAHPNASGAWDPADLSWCRGKQGTV